MIAPEPCRTRWVALRACDAHSCSSSASGERGEASDAPRRKGRERVGRCERAWVLRPTREAKHLTGKPSPPN